MKSVLVFIDGTICDTRARNHLVNTADFYLRNRILTDRPIDGSVECLAELAKRYDIVYLGARPEFTRQDTEEWLITNRYPKGCIFLAEEQEDRIRLIQEIQRKHNFIAGIGDRWDDNELHSELGCLSIILQEYAGKWETVAERIDNHYRKSKVEENLNHLQGKVEGLARVCPLLSSKIGEKLWETYFDAVMEIAENSRETRRVEDLSSFAKHNLDPTDLRDVARWDELLREEDWENNPAYGLQSFELVEAKKQRYVHKVTHCMYAELWKRQGKPDIGYQIHCHTDFAWWDRPAWNPEARFEQPKTIMRGDDYCLFILSLPGSK